MSEEAKEEAIEEEQMLDLDDVAVTPAMDLTPYEGKKLKIEKMTVMDVDSVYDENGKYNPKNPRKVKVLKIESEIFAEIDTDDGKKPLRASRLFNLKLDAKSGKWGVSTSEKSKLRAFMNKKKVQKVNDLIGIEIIPMINENNFMEFAL